MNRFAAFRASIVAAAALAISACGINSVPAAEETAKAKWADVEAAFQERANLVPNLEQIVMSSAEQERATLESVIQARASATRPEIQLDGNDLSDADKMAQYQQAQNTFGGALSRLMAKDVIAADQDGRRFLYRPVIARDDYVASETGRMVSRLFGGRVSPLVAQLASQDQLSADDIAELEEILKGLKS